MPSQLKPASEWRRLLIKVSGEALMGDGAHGISQKTLQRISSEIVEVVRSGCEVGLVIGGGNFLRGANHMLTAVDRVAGDQMGMLATVMNAVAVAAQLRALGTEAVVLSAIDVPVICDRFTHRGALKHMAEGRVVLFAAGTGHPFFTTDTAASLRAVEMGCDALLKGTNVDGVYTADPKSDPNATRYETVTHQEALEKNLGVMDAAAIALARDNGLPIVVFSIKDEGALPLVARGEGVSTIVCD
ncbi:UMP kinase [Acuticoccus sp. MNP-M23]|uniref:UMP kinase n=1 Tax=Acuticoccus sp. MNP-M23 TaxID=3072793 RepID=UPI0028161C2B|nr:UMP kinase [Acuticoccus sp. MNP-M23]WMS41179.1 UMP kinase [Acuticoccus sp. MNP-M23]